MKPKVFGVLAASIVLLSMGAGGARSQSQRAGNQQDENHNAYCEWKLERKANGKMERGSFKEVKKSNPAATGTCSVEEYPITSLCLYNPSDKDKKCTQILQNIDRQDGAFDFWTTGSSCRWCYVNASGSISCVVYSGSC